jgi:SAM-dependent methyltransferase
MGSLKRKIRSGHIDLGRRRIEWNVRAAPATAAHARAFDSASFQAPYRLHLGPGPNWHKPSGHWINVDIDPARGDLVVDFQNFVGFPLDDRSVACIYGSHVFEHMSIWVTDAVFADCARVLQPGGVLRMVLPDAEKGVREYVAGNADYELFRQRRARAKASYGLDYTLFDCLREDFLSRSQQSDLLGAKALAHQNAWDFETIARDLRKAGFSDVTRSGFQQSATDLFSFEGSYDSEANQHYRSLYVEATK